MSQQTSERKDGEEAAEGVKDETARIPSDTLRQFLGDYLDRAFLGERLTITRNGKRVAALVPAADLDRLIGAA